MELALLISLFFIFKNILILNVQIDLGQNKQIAECSLSIILPKHPISVFGRNRVA